MRTDTDAGRAALHSRAQIAFGGKHLGFSGHRLCHQAAVPGIGKQRDRAKRTGLHTILAADTFFRVHDHLMITRLMAPLVQAFRQGASSQCLHCMGIQPFSNFVRNSLGVTGTVTVPTVFPK